MVYAKSKLLCCLLFAYYLLRNNLYNNKNYIDFSNRKVLECRDSNGAKQQRIMIEINLKRACRLQGVDLILCPVS